MNSTFHPMFLQVGVMELIAVFLVIISINATFHFCMKEKTISICIKIPKVKH